ncbi:MAG: HAMP domain-containing protein [Magnetococcales bacterium]|nr:HAMP domain-containing protein [Magnetococcales bacterium]
MNLGIRGKLILVSLVLDLILLVQVAVSLEINLEERLVKDVEEHLLSHAKSARVLLANVPGDASIAEMDRLIDNFGEAVENRVTIVSNNGKVVGDSQLEPGQILQTDNHANRPEIIAALKEGTGISRRYSETLEVDMLYIAVSATRGGQTMVVRVAKSMKKIQQAIQEQRRFLIKASVLSLAMALILTAMVLDFLTRTFRKLVYRAKQMSRDISEHPIQIASKDEIGGLASSFNTMAEQLDRTVMELAQDRAWMNAILEGMNEGVIALNCEKQITLINRSARQMLNVDSSSIGGLLEGVVPKEVYDGIMGLDADSFFCKVKYDFFTSGQKYLQIMGSMMKNRGCVLVFRDVTEIRHMDQMQRDFVANVSHELRTPVHAVLANAELLQELVPKEEKQLGKLSTSLERNALRLSRIISNLLYLSKLDADKQSMQVTETPLLSTVRQAMNMAAEAAQEKQINMTCLVEPDIHFLADSEVLSEVILFNLLDNAIKYCPEQSSITIRTRKVGCQYRVEVEDNGPGIPPEHQSRIFGRFYRVSKNRSRELGGTGLGLSIVQQWVRKMDGEVGMEPILPHGSLFWISLPSPKESPNPDIS